MTFNKWESCYEDFVWGKDSYEMKVGLTANISLNMVSWQMNFIFDPIYQIYPMEKAR